MPRASTRLALLGVVFLLAACVSSRTPRETGPILIGLYADLSSTGARDGNDALKGAQLRVKEVNAAGGLGGRSIELRVIDMMQNPADAVKAYTSLAQEEGVCAVIGSTAANAELAVSPVAELVKVPLVSLSLDDRVTTPEMKPESPNTVGRSRQFSFLVQPSASQIASAIAAYSVEHFPLRRFATLYDPSSAVSVLQARSFENVVKQADKIVAVSVELPQGEPDYVTPLSKIRDSGVDAVFVCGSAEENFAVALKAKEMAYQPVLLGNQAWYSPVPGESGDAAISVWFCAGISPNDPALTDLGVRFAAEFGELPRPAVVPGWDAVGLVLAAVRKAGSASPRKVRDALEQTVAFKALAGQIDIDRKTHRTAGHPVAIMRTAGGRYLTVEPRYLLRATRGGGQP